MIDSHTSHSQSLLCYNKFTSAKTEKAGQIEICQGDAEKVFVGVAEKLFLETEPAYIFMK